MGYRLAAIGACAPSSINRQRLRFGGSGVTIQLDAFHPSSDLKRIVVHGIEHGIVAGLVDRVVDHGNF
jgi:hypothetical protein